MKDRGEHICCLANKNEEEFNKIIHIVNIFYYNKKKCLFNDNLIFFLKIVQKEAPKYQTN